LQDYIDAYDESKSTDRLHNFNTHRHVKFMTMDKTGRAKLPAALVDATATAGFVVWDHYLPHSQVQYKGDSSPVTAADRAGRYASDEVK
jgi:hypothetical protein